MASLLTHPMVPLAAASLAGRRVVPLSLLDACTDAGLGVAFFWPWSEQRTFFSFRPIEASPVSARRFLSGRGWEVFQSELIRVRTSLVLLGLLGYFIRRRLCASQ